MKAPPLRLGFQLTLLLLLLLFGWWLLRTSQLQEIGRIVQQLTLAKGAFLVAANLLVLLTLAGRWWLFLFGLGHRLPFLALLRYRIAAFAVSYFTPGPHFGGEPLQVYLVHQRHDVPTATAIASVTLDKVLEMTINFAVLAVGALLILQQETLTTTLISRPRPALVSVLLLLPAVGLVVWVGRQRLAHRVNHKALSGRLARWLDVLKQSWGQMVDLWRSKPALFLAAGAVSLLSWGALIGEFWYMTAALELDLGFTQAMTLLFAMRVAILLPMPAGLGALEAGLALATTALGLSPAAGLSMSLLIRLRDVLLGLLGLWLGGFALWPQRLTPSIAHMDRNEHNPPY
ncbi:MAG: UPF0104 family protein [Caldilinea sp. CFX5]|nr:UPF0104 family protein [Caldilinea sp. CFX5]